MDKKSSIVLGVFLGLIISVLMTLLLVSAMAMPAMACQPGTTCGNESIVGDPIELTGAEKSKVVGMALKNSQVKGLQKQLVDEGFTQKDAEAFNAPIEEDGLRTEVLFVAIPFQEGDSQEGKTIIYSHNPRTRESTTVVIQGALSNCVSLSGEYRLLCSSLCSTCVTRPS